jgi:hypothetical protein
MCLRTSDSLLNEVLQPRTGHTARFLPRCRSSTSEVRLNEFRVEPLVAFGAETCEIACSGGASESMLAKSVVMEIEVIKAPCLVAIMLSASFWGKGNPFGMYYLPRSSAHWPSNMGIKLVTSVSKLANSSVAGKPL